MPSDEDESPDVLRKAVWINNKGHWRLWSRAQVFYNHEVSIEEESRQQAFWKKAQRDSEKRAKKLINELKREMNPDKMKDDITDEMIERAKDYPVENLVDIGKAGICCLWHDEKTASMKLTKRNRLRCYGACGKSFDSIDVYRHLHGATFIEAVKALN